MASGKCVGCGRQGPSGKIYAHVTECPPFLALPYSEQTDPVEAYAEWQAEGKQEAREVRKVALSDREVELRSAADARWATPKDMLED